MTEPPPTAVEDLANALASNIATAGTRPLLFGHSMGAILAFEVARRLEKLGRPAAYLFVSGRPAPPEVRPLQLVSRLPRDRFVQMLRDYGSADEEILTNDELLDVLIPMIRADFGMIEAYHYQPGPPLSCPIYAWCGTDDPEVDLSAMQGWAHETTAGLKLCVRHGGHFFVTGCVDEISRTVHDAITRIEDTARPNGTPGPDRTARSNRIAGPCGTPEPNGTARPNGASPATGPAQRERAQCQAADRPGLAFRSRPEPWAAADYEPDVVG